MLIVVFFEGFSFLTRSRCLGKMDGINMFLDQSHFPYLVYQFFEYATFCLVHLEIHSIR